MHYGTFSADEWQLILDMRSLPDHDQRILCDVASRLATQASAATPANVVPLLAHPITSR